MAVGRRGWTAAGVATGEIPIASPLRWYGRGGALACRPPLAGRPSPRRSPSYADGFFVKADMAAVYPELPTPADGERYNLV